VTETVNEAFHTGYYDSEVWKRTFWLGVPAQKTPFDLWTYQELLYEVRPRVIVETGTAHGGSALFLATVCDALRRGEVVSVDIHDPGGRPRHPRITYVEGSSTSPEVFRRVVELVAGREPVLVVLDSDHARDHVLEELRLYAPLVTPGSYLVVEDTNVNGRPVFPDHGPGPAEALEAYLGEGAEFDVDADREKFGLTFNPGGYLRRRATM
jgi:cephalosporin hydroxylase